MTIRDNDLLADRSERSARIKVWDLAVRLFHWSLVFCFAVAWISGEVWDKLHEYSGYIVGALIAFRLLWGLVGGKYAKFSNFCYKPSTVFAYLRSSLTGNAKRYLGHNPAGGAMVIALLMSVSALVISGIAMVSDRYWGVEWVGEIHEILSSFTLFLVALHVAGVIHASFAHHENLVRSMVTGLKDRYNEHQ